MRHHTGHPAAYLGDRGTLCTRPRRLLGYQAVGVPGAGRCLYTRAVRSVAGHRHRWRIRPPGGPSSNPRRSTPAAARHRAPVCRAGPRALTGNRLRPAATDRMARARPRVPSSCGRVEANFDGYKEPGLLRTAPGGDRRAPRSEGGGQPCLIRANAPRAKRTPPKIEPGRLLPLSIRPTGSRPPSSPPQTRYTGSQSMPPQTQPTGSRLPPLQT